MYASRDGAEGVIAGCQAMRHGGSIQKTRLNFAIRGKRALSLVPQRIEAQRPGTFAVVQCLYRSDKALQTKLRCLKAFRSVDLTEITDRRRRSKMRYLRYLALLSIFLLPAAYSQAQVAVGIRVGPGYGYVGAAPACAYGYYAYYPYACAPYGYYGPQWFAGGVFIGAGPWYHGYYGHGYYGRGYGYYRPGYGYYGRGGYGHYGRGYYRPGAYAYNRGGGYGSEPRLCTRPCWRWLPRWRTPVSGPRS